jgi:hypothetical protein
VGVLHDHAPSGRSRHVDIVDADPGPAHDQQVGRRFQNLGGHLGGRSHHEALVLADDLQELSRFEPNLHVDLDRVAGGAKNLDAARGQIIGHQNLECHGPSAVTSPARGCQGSGVI